MFTFLFFKTITNFKQNQITTLLPQEGVVIDLFPLNNHKCRCVFLKIPASINKTEI